MDAEAASSPSAAERERRRAEAVSAGAQAAFVGAMGSAGVLAVLHTVLREAAPAYRAASAYPKRIVAAVLVAGVSGFSAQRTPGALAQHYVGEDLGRAEAAARAARGRPG